jgi:DNA adenine methylase
MRYVGSKRKIAKRILAEILSRRGDRNLYWEPFVGGCNSFSIIAPYFHKAYGSDAHLDLIMMWQAVMDGWTPPESITEDEYNALRHAEPSPLRAFAGFGGSFGGKWFGGYQSNGSPRNYQAESARAVISRRRELGDSPVQFASCSYDRGLATSNMVVYCDPPYASTLGYKGTDAFDHAAFWQWCRDQADHGALVFVSEYTAPEDVACIAEFDHRMSVSLTTDRKTTVERLFMIEGTS